ncbi:hypothetical protein K490DRAFT_4112, partial [Saccharata proteae CBS 121410]
NHHRRPTYPLANTSRKKPRRWPLVLRFYKGAIHSAILLPVLLHSLFTVLVVYVDGRLGPNQKIGLPSSIIPSLSIVVGLMLVFRNQTSYDRFWTGRQLLTDCCASVRNLVRSFLTNCSAPPPSHNPNPTPNTPSTPDSSIANLKSSTTAAERADTETAVRLLLAMLYAIKHVLRAEYSTSTHPDLSPLLPPTMTTHEDRGLGLPLQLSLHLEAYIRRAYTRGWVHGPQASQLSVQLNSLMTCYGRMEAIRTTPIPVAHLIHTKQVLALYAGVLPFSLVDEFGWWSVPIVALIAFTLYGIDGIGSQLEDPFGYDRNDIRMDGILEDAKTEVLVLLEEWR